MSMRRVIFGLFLMAIAIGLAFATPAIARAQEEQPPTDLPPLSLSTQYPQQVIGIGEDVSLRLKLVAGERSQVVTMDVESLPEGWQATFRGGGRVIKAVYVEVGNNANVDLRVDPPADVAPGAYRFVVVARGEGTRAGLPIELTVEEKVPPRLSFDIDLPTLKGSPSTTFRYNTTLKNEGDEDLVANLVAEVPAGFLARFKVSGQEVTNLPLTANESQRVNIEVEPVVEIPAGSYPITVLAQGGEVQARLDLTAEVTGQASLSMAAPDGRLSGRATAGRESMLKVIIRNTGSAAAQGIKLSSTEPNGWTVTFDPDAIPEIPAGEQAEVNVNIRPAEKAVAGDYMVTVRARPAEGASESADFRITVTTSTIWGVVGVGLIAVAVAVVALAVMRFGRR